MADVSIAPHDSQDNAVAPWMNMPLERALFIMRDMSWGQLYNLSPYCFIHTPEEGLTLIAAACVAMTWLNEHLDITDPVVEEAASAVLDAKVKMCDAMVNGTEYVKRALLGEPTPLLSIPDYYSQRGPEPTEPRKKGRAGYVYVLHSPTGAYKIGYTVNPASRAKTFNVKLPFEVEFDTLIQTDDMRGLEAELHERYWHKHINGEWFALDESDLAELRALAEVRS